MRMLIKYSRRTVFFGEFHLCEWLEEQMKDKK